MKNQQLQTRRDFLGVTLAAASGAAIGVNRVQAKKLEALPMPSAAKLPAWRGFNLLEKFTARDGGNPPFQGTDFECIAELGFNFVRLPLSYRCWTDPQDWKRLLEPELKHIDQAVEFGRKYGVHVNINFHRAPGYCVNPPKEPLDLWSNDEALEVCALHWNQFAKRYKGVPNHQVTFDLLNEPGDFTEAAYVRVVRRLTAAIREADPERVIIADGLRWGSKPAPALKEFGVAQSTRGYQPSRISHYKANWMSGSDKWPEPTWPLKISEKDVWDKERLRKEQIEPWQALARSGVGVHVGEWGAFQHTPHAVTLAWMRDYLELWKEAGWGWALWNFRGSFGVLDSGRKDVEYENWRGHKLDRRMLELLQTF